MDNEEEKKDFEASRLSKMTPEQIKSLSDEEFKEAFKKDRVFTVREAIEWLSTKNPDAGIFYFDQNSNAWCDASKDFFRTVAEEKIKEEENLKHWYRDTKDADKRIKEDMEEAFRYVDDDDICIVA